MARLETLQLSIRELILQAPNQDEEEELLSMVTSWAKELAKDPLGDPILTRRSNETPERYSLKKSSDSSNGSSGQPKGKLSGFQK